MVLTCPGTPRAATICTVNDLPPGNRSTDAKQCADVKSPDVEQQPIVRNPCDDNYTLHASSCPNNDMRTTTEGRKHLSQTLSILQV